VPNVSTVSDATYERLRTMICRGRLRPGDRIVERDLARRLRVSRIPLREGLARLEAEGLVRSVPNSATFVETFAPSDVLEMYQMRLLLEPFAARLAAGRREPALPRELVRLLGQMTAHAARGDLRRLDDADYRFHLAIVRASGHGRLLRAYGSSPIQVIGLRSGYAHLRESPPEATADEHRRIVDAIAAGRPAAAERAAADHVRGALRAIDAAVAHGEAPVGPPTSASEAHADADK
jgi:DNA-binding GntR family transcriptional regulator